MPWKKKPYQVRFWRVHTWFQAASGTCLTVLSFGLQKAYSTMMAHNLDYWDPQKYNKSLYISFYNWSIKFPTKNRSHHGKYYKEKKRSMREVFCLLFVHSLKTSLQASFSSSLYPQIISSHAPVLWSLWGLLWLSYPCKSRGQPQPPVLRNICPQKVLPRHRSAASTPLESSKDSMTAKGLFLGTLIGDHFSLAGEHLMLPNDHMLQQKCRLHVGLRWLE